MWNGPVNGSYAECDFTQPPWVAGCATLTHEEVVFVKETIAPFVEERPYDDFYAVSSYNNATAYEKAINGETYAVIKQYDVEINTLGIDGAGIILPVEEPVETPVEGE